MKLAFSVVVIASALQATQAGAQSPQVKSIVSSALSGQPFDILGGVGPSDDLNPQQLKSLLDEANRLRSEIGNSQNANENQPANARFFELAVMDIRAYRARLQKFVSNPNATIAGCSDRPALSISYFDPGSMSIRLGEYPWLGFGTWASNQSGPVWNKIASEVNRAYLFGNLQYNKLNEIRFRSQYMASAKRHGQSPFMIRQDSAGQYTAMVGPEKNRVKRFVQYYQIPYYCILADSQDFKYEMRDMENNLRSIFPG